MEYKNKSNAGLSAELVNLGKQIAKLGKNNSKPQKTKKTLIENGRKFHTLVESAHDAIFTVQGDCFIDCNTKTLEIFGLTSKKSIIGKPPYFFSPEMQPDGRSSKEKSVSAILAAQHGTPQFFEWKHKKLDGTIFDTEVSLNRLSPPNEPLVIAIVRDVTERKRAEAELRESEEKYRLLYQEFQGLLNAIPDNLTLVAPDLKIIWANEGATGACNRKVSDFVGHHCYQVWRSRATACTGCPVTRCFCTGKTEVNETIMPDGTIWDIRAVPLFGEQGEVKGVIDIACNITERKRAEEDLKRLNEQLLKEHRQRKLLSKRLIQLLEKHNQKISMDLHDHVGQSLVTIKIDLDMIHGRTAKTDNALTALVEKAQTKTVQAIEDVEKIAYGLRPSMIDNLGLVPSLRDLFKELQDHAKIKIHFFNRGIPKRFDAEKELAIFRVAQEALCNVLKHSQAENCFVNLVTKGNSIALSVEDDGIGFKPREKKCTLPAPGKVPLGLVFMQERVVQVKGNFTVESRVGGGVHLVAKIPL